MTAKRSDKATIYHVELTSGEHHYFGSIAAIFTILDRNTIKVSKQRLYDIGITSGITYSNKSCIIRVGRCIRKSGGRGNKTKKL